MNRVRIVAYGMSGLLVLGSIFSTLPQTRLQAAPKEDKRVDVIIGFKQKPEKGEHDIVENEGGKIKHSYHLVPAVAANIPESKLDKLRKHPKVTTVELDGDVQAIDAELDNTWGVKHIGAGTVHSGGNTGGSVAVAVLDSGIDYNHPDLNANYAGGYDFVNSDNDPKDNNGHGTHVSGTVAAEDNSAGVVGTGPTVRIYALKVLNSSGSGKWSNIIAAVQWVVDNGIKITNNSYGGSINPGTIVETAFKNAEAAGVLNVAAAGNSGNCPGSSSNVGYPAKYSSVIAVAAVDSNNKRACFSSTGSTVELSAPGVNINSTTMGGGYAAWNGTSMASPHVAGTAALVLARSGGVSDKNSNGRINDEIRQILQTTAKDLGPSGKDKYYGYGLVQADKAVIAP